MGVEKTVYIFVGIPAIRSTYSQMMIGSDHEIEAEIDNMIDTLEGTRIHKAIWTVASAEECSYEEAFMKFCRQMIEEEVSRYEKR